jgi:hypothetical protein
VKVERNKEDPLTRAVSCPIPPLPPVIITTFPAWSGTSVAVHVGFGGKVCLKIPIRFSDMTQRGSKMMADVGTITVGKRERKGETTRRLFV